MFLCNLVAFLSPTKVGAHPTVVSVDLRNMRANANARRYDGHAMSLWCDGRAMSLHCHGRDDAAVMIMPCHAVAVLWHAVAAPQPSHSHAMTHGMGMALHGMPTFSADLKIRPG